MNSASFSLTNIVMIEATTYKMLAKRSDIKTFTVIVSEIDRLIITAEVKPEGINYMSSFTPKL